jgi:hypothetical protein
MLKVADSSIYQLAINSNGRYIFYNGIFLYELKYLFYLSKENIDEDSHDAWIFFNQGKLILFFDKKEEIFFKENIRQIKKRQDFLDRNFIPINNDPLALSFIKATGINYYLDSEWSAEILLHQSDVDFIKKYFIPNPTQQQIDKKFWLDQMENKVRLKDLIEPVPFYLANIKDHVIYNHHVSADIINQLMTPFYLNKNNALIIPRKKIEPIKSRLHRLNPNLIAFYSNTFAYTI